MNKPYPRVDHMDAECPMCKGAFKFAVKRWADGETRPQTILLLKHKPCGVVKVEVQGPAWRLLMAIAERSKSSRGRGTRRKP